MVFIFIERPNVRHKRHLESTCTWRENYKIIALLGIIQNKSAEQQPEALVTYNVRSIYVTNNVMVWESNAVAHTIKETCCSLVISPDGSKMLDKGSPSITPLEEAKSFK